MDWHLPACARYGLTASPATRPCGPRPAPPGPASPRGCGPYLDYGWAEKAAPQGVRHRRSLARRRLQTLQSRARGCLCMQTPSPARAASLPGPAPEEGPSGRGRGQRGGAAPAGWCERSFDPAPGAGPAGRGGASGVARGPFRGVSH